MAGYAKHILKLMANRKPISNILLTLLILIVLPLVSYLFLKGGEKLRSERKVPHFELQDQNGEIFNSKELEGKIYAAGFVFSRCNYYCDEVNEAMKRLNRKFGNNPDFMLLTFTIDPEFDSLEVISQLASSLQADASQWKVLRGDVNDIYDLVNGGFFGRAKYGDGTPEKMRADPKISLIDRNGFIYGYFGVDEEKKINRLMKIVKRLLTEQPEE